MDEIIYKFKLTNDYTTSVIEDGKNLLAGVTYDSEWLRIDNGVITIPKGYAWNGCSPKWRVGGNVIGTFDGFVDASTLLPRAYHASLIHDALCEHQDYLGVPREVIDRCLYVILKRDDFLLAWTYYAAVRVFDHVSKLVKVLKNVISR